MRILRCPLVALVLTFSPCTVSAEPTWYLSLGVGRARIQPIPDKSNQDAALASSGFTGIESSDSDDATASRIIGGYDFSDNVGIALSYLDLHGVYSYTAQFFSGSDRGAASTRWNHT